MTYFKTRYHTPINNVYTALLIHTDEWRGADQRGTHSWDDGAQPPSWAEWVLVSPFWLSLNSAVLNPRHTLCSQPSTGWSKRLPSVLSASPAVPEAVSLSPHYLTSLLQAKQVRLIRKERTLTRILFSPGGLLERGGPALWAGAGNRL